MGFEFGDDKSQIKPDGNSIDLGNLGFGPDDQKEVMRRVSATDSKLANVEIAKDEQASKAVGNKLNEMTNWFSQSRNSAYELPGEGRLASMNLAFQRSLERHKT